MDIMTLKRIAFGLLILPMLACNYVTQMIVPPTATPAPTATPLATQTATPIPLAPAYIAPECQASAPFATVSPDLALAQPTLTLEPNPSISTTDQLDVFDELTGIVDDVYVYPDFNGKDWEEIKSRYRAKVEAGLETEAFYLEMRAMIVELGDEHSYFLSPLDVEASEAELRGENNYVGVGIFSLPDYERQIVSIISTFPDSPAEHAGLQPHDKIIAVDGVPLQFETDATRQIRGPKCSAVVLTVQTPGEEPRDVMLVRASIQGNLNIVSQLVPTTDGSKIGYIFIPTFFDETIPPQIEAALEGFGPLDGLILDVRLNGGGSSSVVDPIFELFVDGVLGKFVSRSESRQLRVKADPIHNSQTVPIIVIVSEDTVSYGEIFSGVLKDLGRARIVGQTSLGNVEVLHGYEFDDNSQVWVASETFYSATSETNFELSGIIPDVEAFAEWDLITFETDPAIKAALELLGH
jgi:carboxyl-terminal processing protease